MVKGGTRRTLNSVLGLPAVGRDNSFTAVGSSPWMPQWETPLEFFAKSLLMGDNRGVTVNVKSPGSVTMATMGSITVRHLNAMTRLAPRSRIIRIKR